MSKIPVFDFGDTLVPCFRLQNELMEDEMKEYGAEKVPEFDVNNFRIYTPSEVKEYMEKHDLEHADPLRIIEKYKQRERRFMEQYGVFRFLKKCSEEFGHIGVVSDNTIEGKKWLQTQMAAHGVPYKGLVVSEEVGAEKPDPAIFRKFIEIRDKPAEEFIYFGNNLERDPACGKVGMDFVFVDQYNTFGENNDYRTVTDLTVENLREVLE